MESEKKTMMFPKTVDYYLHGDRDTNYYKGKELGLTEEALKKFSYACYEVPLTLVVHADGTSYVTHFHGQELKEKVQVS